MDLKGKKITVSRHDAARRMHPKRHQMTWNR